MIINNHLRPRILMMAEPAQGAGSDALAQLRAENEALKNENAELKKVTALEPAIKEKMAAGLTREQAESVIKQQEDHDKYLAKLEADQAKAKKEAAKK